MNSVAKREQGSALVESVVLMGVLLPVIFGVVMIGKLIDVKQTSEQAGRYAAWEATVYPQSGAASARPLAVKERFFGDTSLGLASLDVESGSHRLWGETDEMDSRGWADRTAVQIDESTVMVAGYERDIGESSIAMRVGQVAGSAGNLLDGLSGNSWGLTTNGLVRAHVGVQIKSNDWLQSDEQSCGQEGNYACLRSSSVILVDGWSASDDDHARRRVRSLVPASALQPLGDIISNVGYLPMFKELKKLDGAFGHVNMDALPEYAQ